MMIFNCLLILLFSCGSDTNSVETSNENLLLNICDSTYVFEKPEWWDSIDLDLFLIDSLVNKTNTLKEYRLLTRNVDRRLLRKYTYNESYERVEFKRAYYFHHKKSEPLDEFIRTSQYFVSYKMSAKLKSFVYDCASENHKSGLALSIGEEYFNAGLLDESLLYLKQALDLSKGGSGYYYDKLVDRIQQIEGIKDKDKFLKKHLYFRKTLDSLVNNIDELRTNKRLEELNSRMYSVLDSKFPELKHDNKSNLIDLNDYDLALQYLIYDEHSQRELNTKQNIEKIKQSFRDANLDDTGEDIIIIMGTGSMHNKMRDEWVVDYSSPNIDFWIAADFERYELRGTNTID